MGDAAGMVMYKMGYEFGLQDFKDFQTRFEREYGGSTRLSDANVNFILEQWWWPLNAEGWGGYKVDFSHRKQGIIFVDVYDSAVAKSVGNIGKPVCHIYAGMFAGALTYLSKHELSGIEIQCFAMGEEYCKFLIGSEKRVNAASFWVQEGASSGEIMEKIGD